MPRSQMLVSSVINSLDNFVFIVMVITLVNICNLIIYPPGIFIHRFHQCFIIRIHIMNIHPLEAVAQDQILMNLERE